MSHVRHRILVRSLREVAHRAGTLLRRSRSGFLGCFGLFAEIRKADAGGGRLSAGVMAVLIPFVAALFGRFVRMGHGAFAL